MRAGKSVDLNTLDYLFCVFCEQSEGELFVRGLGVLLNFCILSLLTECFPR